MKAPSSTLLALFVLLPLVSIEPEAVVQAPSATRPQVPGYATVGAAPCKPVGAIQFICTLVSPEDLAIIPASEWVIASGNREGGRLHLVNVRQKTATVLFPTPKPPGNPGNNVQFDRKTYPICPGPIDIDKPDTFRAHGLYLEPGQRSIHKLYVVHHGTRESIEVFELNAGAAPPVLTWVGCAPAPPKQTFNSVVALPDGGFAATSNATDVRRYQPATGWSLVPGSEGSAANGLEISKDGQWLYVAGWAEEKLTRLSRGRTPVQKDVIKLGFRPDNVRLSPDGSVLFAAGHTDKDGRSIAEPREPLRETSNVARIDPKTLEFRRIFQHPAIDGFVTSTTGVQIGNELWLGSQRGDRIAFLPMPK
jgi:hypothetical protein